MNAPAMLQKMRHAFIVLFAAVATALALVISGVDTAVAADPTLLAALVSAPSFSTQPTSVSSSSSADPVCTGDVLQCWLNTLVINIPDQDIQIPVGILGTIELIIQKFHCQNITIAAANSALLSDVNSVTVALSGIGTTCLGDWTINWGLVKGTGTLSAVISQTTLNATVAIESSEGPIPMADKAVTKGCTMAVQSKIDFGGNSLIDKFLEFIAPVVDGLIDSEVPAAVCGILTSVINTNLTQVLLAIDDALKPALLPPTPNIPIPAKDMKELVKFENIGLFNTIDGLLNGLLLNGGTAVNCLTKGFFPSGSLTLPVLPQNTTIALAGLGNITFNLPNVTVSGLDTFEHLELLHMNATAFFNELVLRTRATLRQLQVSVWIDLYVFPSDLFIGGASLHEQFQLNLTMGRPDLVIDTELGIVESKFNSRSFDQLFPDANQNPPGDSSACFLSTLHTANLTQLMLNVSIDEISILPVASTNPGPLEYGIDLILDNIVKLCVTKFPLLVTEVIAGGLNGVLRDTLNAASTAAIVAAGPKCPPPPPLRPHNGTAIIDWQTSILPIFSFLISDIIGAKGFNNILACAESGFPKVSGVVVDINQAGLHFDVRNVEVENVASLNGLMLLWPTSPFDIYNALTVGYAPYVPPLPVLASSAAVSPLPAHMTVGTIPSLHAVAATVSAGVRTHAHASSAVPVALAQHEAASASVEIGVGLLRQLRRSLLAGHASLSRLHPPSIAHLDGSPLTPSAHTGGRAAALSTRGVGVPVTYPGLKVSLMMDIQYGDFTSQINLTLGITNLTLQVGLGMELDYFALMDSKMSALFNNWCFLSMFQAFNFSTLSVTMDDLLMDVVMMGKTTANELRLSLNGTNFTAAANKFIAEGLQASTSDFNANSPGWIANAVDYCVNGVPASGGNNETLTWESTIAVVAASSLTLMGLFVYWQRRAGGTLPDWLWFGATEPSKARGGKDGMMRQSLILGQEEMDDDEDEGEDNGYNGGPSGKLAMWRGQKGEDGPVDWYDSLVCSERLPLYLRVLVPGTLVFTIGTFLYSNLSIGAAVGLKLELVGELINAGGLFDFTLANSVHDMWQAGVYPLSILIALFSGAWPYTKLLLMIATWVIPVGLLSVKRREQVLMWLDRLGKWSLLDSFVLILMLVAFRFHIALGDAVVVDVLVDPESGFYSFLLATMISLGMSHIMLAIHRHVSTNFKIRKGGPMEALCDHAYKLFTVRPLPGFHGYGDGAAEEDHLHSSMSSLPSPLSSGGLGLNRESGVKPSPASVDNAMAAARRQEVDRFERLYGSEYAHVPKQLSPQTLAQGKQLAVRVKCSLLGQLLLGLTLGFTFVMVVWGSVCDTFTFEFAGAAGLALGDGASRSYSLVSLGQVVPQSARDPESLSIRWLQTVYFVFTLGMPLAFLVCVFVLWVYPLTLANQRSVFILSEILYAWAGLDVFILSIMAAVLEISQFALFIIGDHCAGINQILAIILDGPLHGDDVCFDLRATLGPGAFTLLAAAVLFLFMGQVFASLGHLSLEQRLKQHDAIIRRASRLASPALGFEQACSIGGGSGGAGDASALPVMGGADAFMLQPQAVDPSNQDKDKMPADSADQGCCGSCSCSCEQSKCCKPRSCFHLYWFLYTLGILDVFISDDDRYTSVEQAVRFAKTRDKRASVDGYEEEEEKAPVVRASDDVKIEVTIEADARHGVRTSSRKSGQKS